MNLATKAFLWVFVSFLYMAICLFLAAGTLAWSAGWVFLILLHGWLLIGVGLLLKYNPGLLAGAHQHFPIKPKSLGQSLYFALATVPLCLVDTDAA